ncbi:hypothetical protein PCANC_10744 [Puccinia coronata f. sp. avenae]|uniref:Protein kinase domain-containing protein n=1 Tax=Puccinia coronata f. sp. avenae TaxID=200324 RepID=A0A2N5VSR8_9BASI|nr:hypothetical protein PCANC_10744 [Puccinia coronata f. sp. avenae]
MPYLDGGTLADQIFSQQHFVRNPTHIRRVFFQIASAVNFCHAHGVAHQDIKPQKILCTLNRLHVSLSDFGLATYECHSSSFQCGTRAYMGPECLGGLFAPVQFYDTFANDIWSLGIVLMNLLASGRPWEEATMTDPHFHAFVMQDTDVFNPIGAVAESGEPAQPPIEAIIKTSENSCPFSADGRTAARRLPQIFHSSRSYLPSTADEGNKPAEDTIVQSDQPGEANLPESEQVSEGAATILGEPAAPP